MCFAVVTTLDSGSRVVADQSKVVVLVMERTLLRTRETRPRYTVRLRPRSQDRGVPYYPRLGQDLACLVSLTRDNGLMVSDFGSHGIPFVK